MTRRSNDRPGKTSPWLLAVLGLAVGAAAGGLGVYYGTGKAARPDGEPDPEPAAPAGNAVVALGRLEPETGVVSLAGPVGDRIAKILVREGDPVEPGAELVVLESRADRQAEVELLEGQLADAKKRRELVLKQGEAQLREANERIEHLRTTGPLDLATQDARVRLLEQQEAAARKQLDRLDALREGSVPQSEREQAALAARQASEELAAARALRTKTDIAHRQALQSAETQRTVAETTQARALQEISLESLSKQLELAKLRLARSTIRAPVVAEGVTKGRVLAVLARPGEATTGQPVLQMAYVGAMVAVAEVYETDLGALRGWGAASARVTSKALPQPLTGTVARIGGVIGRNRLQDIDPRAAADRRVAEVRVRLDQDEVAAQFIHLQVTVTLTPGGGGASPKGR